jgi:Ca2+-binding RTX toxin-like protein
MAILYRRKGGDMLVNTQTAFNQSAAAVAVTQSGGYVVVWTDSSLIGGDSSGSGIKAQRFDGSGNKLGGEFLVNTTTAAAQATAAVATLSSGRFVVTWTDFSATGGDTSSRAIRGQLFEANGTPVGSEFLVNTQTAGIQEGSAVTELAGGGFVVSWADSSGIGGDNSGSGIKAQLFDTAGAKVGGEILVNTTISGSQIQPSMISLPGGGFAAVWTGTTVVNGTPVGRAWLQLFDSAGSKVGGEQVVSDTPVLNMLTANITALASGGFMVTWAQQESFAPGPASFDIMGQTFDAAGARVGGNFGVFNGPGSQTVPDAHALPDGTILVTWQGPGEGSSGANIFGQIINGFGGRMGYPFVISEVTALGQLQPEVEVLPNGDIVVVWSDSSMTGGDTDAFSVRSQILTVSNDAPTDIILSGTTLSETAREGVPLAVLSTVGSLNSIPSYTLLSDSSGGAFEIDGDKLVVVDNSLIDYETTAHQVQLLIRTTDENGHSYEETIQLDIVDTPEAGYAPDGNEFRVNTTVQDNQTEPVLTSLASGGYLALWLQWPLGGNGTVVSKGQIFDAAGNKVGGELNINGDSAAGLPDGGFVTAWTQGVSQANLTDIKAQIYDAAGNAVGGEISVNAAVAGYQQFPSVTTLASGGFMISWTDQIDPGTSRIFAQVFLPGGAKLGSEFLVSQFGWESEVATLASGNFVLTWSGGGAIMAQIFSPDGSRFGVEFPVSSLAGFPIEPHITALAGGGFVVTYASNSSGGGFVGIDHLSAQIFDANGVKVGSEILVAADGPSQVGSTDVVALPWGGFVVGWTGQEDDDPETNDAGIRAQVFDSTGTRIGSELAVNQITPNDQIQTAMTLLASGDVVVGWAGGDGSGFGIKARILSPVGPTEGNDILFGTPGVDVIDGLGGNDQIYGLGDADQLTGGSGNDLLDGGAGADSMTGGSGNDVYIVDNAGDTLSENADEGIDEVQTALAAYSLAALANLENLTAASNSAHDLRGNSGNNVITGGGGADLLRLYDGGIDTVIAGAGNDSLFFIGTLTAADIVIGGAGADTLVLQGNYAGGLTLNSNVSLIENISLLGGGNTNFGEPGTNRYDYVITTNDANFAAGVQARINGSALLAGEDFTFNGSAEANASFVVYGGRGQDTLTGGLGNDIFFFAEDRFATGDTVNGGFGYDGMFLRGNYTIDFNAAGYTGLFTSIENLTLTSATDERYARGGGTEFDYNITLSNLLVGAGQVLTVNGGLLMATETMILDGSLESDGVLRLFGGKAGDTLKGGGQADLIHGNLGADTLAGGGGADTFRYDSTAESNSASRDQILDFAHGSDKLDLSRIDANTLAAGNQAFTWIGAGAFTASGAASAGQLRAYQDAGSWFVEGDTNGDGTADLVIQLTVTGGALTQGDFLP